MRKVKKLSSSKFFIIYLLIKFEFEYSTFRCVICFTLFFHKYHKRDIENCTTQTSKSSWWILWIHALHQVGVGVYYMTHVFNQIFYKKCKSEYLLTTINSFVLKFHNSTLAMDLVNILFDSMSILTYNKFWINFDSQETVHNFTSSMVKIRWTDGFSPCFWA